MDEEKQDYKSYAAKNLMLILYYGNVTKVKKIGINSPKTPLLITDRQILYYKTTKKDPFMWLNIKSIAFHEKQIELCFDGKKEIIFSLPKNELLEVFGIIIDLLRRILTKKQKEKIQLNHYLSPQQKSLPTSGFSLISRFLGNADIHSRNGKNLIETLQAFLMIQSPTISNISFKSFDLQEEVVPLILDLLPFIKSVEHFQIVNSSKTFQLLTKYISFFENIVHLSISTTQDKENLNQFISELKSGKTAIEGIDFSLIQLEEEEFRNVCKTIKSAKMCTFGLNSNSISKKYFKSNKFYDDFETNNYLLYLNFNKLYNLNFAKLAPKIRNISILSIANCNIEVSSVFQILNDDEFPKLSEIDISGNVVNQQISSKNSLPPNLYKIVANQIEWKSSEYLRFFFSFIFKRMNSVLYLSVSEISFRDGKSDENWESFFQYLSSIDFKTIKVNSISSFCWDGNKVSSDLFDFLRKCRRLENLSLSYCFHTFDKEELADEESVILICEYLKNAKNIKKLILRGSEKCKLRTLFTKHVVKSIEEMKSIRQIDISNNSISDDGINSLKNMIKKKQQIEEIVFDSSEPLSISPILNIFSFCMKMCQSEPSVSKIKLSFPIIDIYALRDSKKVQKNDLKMLKSYCQCMIDPNLVPNTNSLEGQFPIPQNSPLDQPYFTYFSFHMSDEFQLPKYIKRGSYQKVELMTSNEDEIDEKQKKEKKERKSISNESESEDENDEKKKKKKKNYIRLSEQLKTDSSSDLNDLEQQRNSQKRRKRSLRVNDDDEDDEEEEENIQRKIRNKNKNVNRRKSDTRFVKQKKRIENNYEDEDFEAANYDKRKLKNTQRNRKRSSDFDSSENENQFNSEDDYEEEKPRRERKMSYDEPIKSENDEERQNRNRKTKKQYNFDEINNDNTSLNRNDRYHQKKLDALDGNQKDFSKSLNPKRNRFDFKADDNYITEDNNEGVDDYKQKFDSLWTFPFQPVSVPADNGSYIKSIDKKYSIVALTKMITNE